MSDGKPKDIHIAYHEAGHAVALLEFGVPFDFIIIGLVRLENRSMARGAVFRYCNRLSDELSDLDDAVVDICGPVSVGKFKHTPWFTDSCGCGGDVAKLVAFGRDDQKLIEKTARKIINHRWGLVTAIAQEILERKSSGSDCYLISYEDILKFIGVPK